MPTNNTFICDSGMQIVPDLHSTAFKGNWKLLTINAIAATLCSFNLFGWKRLHKNMSLLPYHCFYSEVMLLQGHNWSFHGLCLSARQ